MNKRKTIILTSIITGVLVLALGLTYAAVTYDETKGNSQLVLGDIWMHYNESDTSINITDLMPNKNYTNDYFEFTISGKNTNTKGNIIYNIQLVEGDVLTIDDETLNRIDSKYLRFRLAEVNGEEEIILKDNVKYENLNGAIIYIDTIFKNTTEDIETTYRLYVRIDENIVIGNTSDANYSLDEWSNLYASIKVNVNGNYVEGENLTNKIKNKLGTEGLVAVNTNGDLYDGTGEIREYRYSGIGNYCTYTDGEKDYNLNVEGETCPQTACGVNSNQFIINGNSETFTLIGGSCADLNGTELPLKIEGSTPTDSGLRNYVEFNGELWRIVGVFGDNVKIVKDTTISNDAYSGTTYTTGDITYNLKFTTEGTKYGYYIFKQLSDNSSDNDWTTSGVMHYLNDETGNSYYVNNLSLDAKNMIEEGIFYTGVVGDNMESASAVYNDEQSNTWTGKIGLLQMSDFLYSTDASIWNVEYGTDIAGLRTSWLGNTEAYAFWLLSPYASGSSIVFSWNFSGRVGISNASSNAALRQVLNLKSTVMTISGDGSYNSPYKLIIS